MIKLVHELYEEAPPRSRTICNWITHGHRRNFLCGSNDWHHQKGNFRDQNLMPTILNTHATKGTVSNISHAQGPAISGGKLEAKAISNTNGTVCCQSTAGQQKDF